MHFGIRRREGNWVHSNCAANLKMQFHLTIIIAIILHITPPTFPIIQLTLNRIPPRHQNSFREPPPPPFNRPQFNRPPNRPRLQFRPPPNHPPRPFFPRPSPQFGSPPRPNFPQPNFQPMAHINRPPGNFQQPNLFRNPPPPFLKQTTTTTTTTEAATTTTEATTTTTKHPLESEENVHTLLSSMEDDGTLQESGWKKEKVKPMLKELWPHYKNVKSMLLERERARMAMINLRNKYHAKRQRLRNWFHLKPFKNGVY